jgi:hypothetical protein
VTGATGRRRPRDRAGLTLAVLATVVGVWLGLSAPDTSPVEPAIPAVPAVVLTR